MLIRVHTHTFNTVYTCSTLTLGEDSDGEWIDIHHSNDNDSDNDVHQLELESEDDSDNWVEMESESENESESLSPGFVEDRKGYLDSIASEKESVSFLKNSSLDTTNTDSEKKVRRSGRVEATKTKEKLAEVKEKRRQRAGDIAQSRVSP